jgi:hypothetical protein
MYSERVVLRMRRAYRRTRIVEELVQGGLPWTFSHNDAYDVLTGGLVGAVVRGDEQEDREPPDWRRELAPVNRKRLGLAWDVGIVQLQKLCGFGPE